MKKLYVLIVLLLLASMSSYAQEQQISGVMVSKVTQEMVAEGREFIGLVKFDRVSSVSTEVSGLVKKVYAKEGERLKAGAPLLALDTELLDQQILAAKAAIDRVSLEAKKVGKNYNRMKELYEKKAASQKDYEDLMYTYKALQRQIAEAEAQLKIYMIQKRKSVVRAPFDAVVQGKNVDKGAWANPGQELFRLGSVNDIYISVPVSETLIQYIEIGDKVNVVVTSYNQQKIGTIFGIEPVADSKTKNMYVKVKVDCGCEIAENMSADVFMPISEKKMLKMIPRDALIKYQGKDFVYTVKDGKATILPVNIVTYKGNFAGVDTPYIVPGMPVVVDGNERLRPDTPVKIVGEK